MTNPNFSRTLSLLRKDKGVSQREAAAALGISQALLSHYENGVREPGLAFVVRACDYYNVSADFLLGRTMSRDGSMIGAEELYDVSGQRDNQLKGSVLALLNKKLVVNAVSVLFGLLGRRGNRKAITHAANALSACIYTLFRCFYISAPGYSRDFFGLPERAFLHGAATEELISAQVKYATALEGEEVPAAPLTHDGLVQDYPATADSLLQVVHATDERLQKRLEE